MLGTADAGVNDSMDEIMRELNVSPDEGIDFPKFKVLMKGDGGAISSPSFKNRKKIATQDF